MGCSQSRRWELLDKSTSAILLRGSGCKEAQREPKRGASPVASCGLNEDYGRTIRRRKREKKSLGKTGTGAVDRRESCAGMGGRGREMESGDGGEKKRVCVLFSKCWQKTRITRNNIIIGTRRYQVSTYGPRKGDQSSSFCRI